MTNIILLNGSAQAGKDTFADFMHELAPKYKRIVVHISTITKIKQIAKQHFNWDSIKDDRGRKLLSDLERARIEYTPNYIIDYISENLAFFDSTSGILIIDARDIDKIKIAKEHFKDQVKTLLIRRPNIPVPDNVADQNVDNFEYDYIIDNNGTLDDLKNKTEEFLHDFKG